MLKKDKNRPTDCDRVIILIYVFLFLVLLGTASFIADLINERVIAQYVE